MAGGKGRGRRGGEGRTSRRMKVGGEKENRRELKRRGRRREREREGYELEVRGREG